MAKHTIALGITALLLWTACGTNDSDNTGHSTPIDSTNLHGTAPATYGGDNPQNIQDTIIPNSNDTGTKISTGPDNTR